MTHEEKLAAARLRYGKPFALEVTDAVKRRVPESRWLIEQKRRTQMLRVVKGKQNASA